MTVHDETPSVEPIASQEQTEMEDRSGTEEMTDTVDVPVNEVIPEPVFGPYSMCTSQNARHSVECRKPRVLYSKT